MSIFTSAVTGRDGLVDAGYLALFWTMVVTVSMVPVVAVFAMWMAHLHADKASEILSGLAMVIGALGAQGAAVIGAVGLFRAGDKSNGLHPSPTVKVEDVKIEGTATPAKAHACKKGG
jgi:hypothetical protein